MNELLLGARVGPLSPRACCDRTKQPKQRSRCPMRSTGRQPHPTRLEFELFASLSYVFSLLFN